MEWVPWLLLCVSDKVRFSLQQERGSPFLESDKYLGRCLGVLSLVAFVSCLRVCLHGLASENSVLNCLWSRQLHEVSLCTRTKRWFQLQGCLMGL